MQLNAKEIEQIEQWLADPSFVQWANASDVEAQKFWNDYFEVHAEQQNLATTAKELVLDLPFRPIPNQVERQEVVLAKVWTVVEERAQAGGKQQSTRHRKLLSIAIGLVLIVVAVLAWQLWNRQTIVIATNFGEQKSFYLPDSSHVVLNGNSTLTYQQHQARKVTLKGEGYFEVNKHKINEEYLPFEVVTDGLSVQVLGTIFNINQREFQTEVFLKEGKVKLAIQLEHDTTLLMQPGELISYSSTAKKFKKVNKHEAKQAISWKDGTIFFKDKTLDYVAQRMKDIYGVTIYISNEQLKQQGITIALPNENLVIAIQTLEQVLDKKLEQIEPKSYLLN
jgi:ferric-dicitrate binding protein FerR (iron transport regulator)